MLRTLIFASLFATVTASFAVSAMAQTTQPAKRDVPLIIFDSDMSSDHDDVGDAAILHGLASMGECKIIGMMVSSRNGGTALCMDAINTYYGKPGIPIGVPVDIGGIGEYAGQIATEFPHALKSQNDCPQAASLYRKLLAESPDKSVSIVTVGYLNNITALLKSKPDEYSPLNGTDLVKQKVKLWSCAGGAFPKGDEFNFRVMAADAYYAINNWPTAVMYTPFDVGQAIYTCGRLPDAPIENPVRRVYVDIKKQYPYPSWGQIAIYYAVRGAGDFWDVQNVGRNNATEQGSNFWTPEPDPKGDDDQGYLLERSRTPVRATLDALIMLPPNDGKPSKPGEPTDLRATVRDNNVDLQWLDNAYNESGFTIERREGAEYKPIATVAANVTTFSDTTAPATANISYRVKSTNPTGNSRYATTWLYSGWTEINFADPASTQPLYDYYPSGDLRPARPTSDTAYNALNDHVTLNNDSNIDFGHGQSVTLDVDVTALGHQGNFYVYFLFQDKDNWYRLTFGEKTCKFEKRIAGKTTDVGPAVPVQNMGNGSPLQHWRIEVTPEKLKFIRDLPFASPTDTQPQGTLLEVSENLDLKTGKIGLGGWARNGVWENFRFETRGVQKTEN